MTPKPPPIPQGQIQRIISTAEGTRYQWSPEPIRRRIPWARILIAIIGGLGEEE